MYAASPDTHFSSSPSEYHSSETQYVVIPLESQPPPVDPEYEAQYLNPGSKFAERADRMLFVRKVLALVGFQLAVCTGFVAVCYIDETLKTFFQSIEGLILGFLCWVAYVMLSVLIGCCGVGRGKPSPCNVTLLLVTTGLLSVFTAAIVVHYELPAIMLAAGTTVGVVLILSLITIYTKFDITGYSLFILGGFIALMLFSLIASVLFAVKVISFEQAYILQFVITGICTVLLALAILYQLKLIFGGGRYQYDPDDWLLLLAVNSFNKSDSGYATNVTTDSTRDIQSPTYHYDKGDVFDCGHFA